MENIISPSSGSSSRLIAAAGLFIFGLAYRYYARWLSKSSVFDIDDRQKTPAYEKEDGVDYVPTNRHVLFGHHFTSIAGAAPIVGPAVAVIWGWLPALCWIVLGSILIGCVHDFGNLVISARNDGRSLADLTGDIVGKKSQALFLILVMLLTWIVLAVFAVIIGLLFVQNPETIIPINIEIVFAVLIGFVIYRFRKNLFFPSLIVLIVLYVAVFFCARPERKVWIPLPLRSCLNWEEAQKLEPELCKSISKTAPIFPQRKKEILKKINTKHQITATRNWVYLLLLYSAIASVLPVWLLLQPRDFINSHQLFVGLGLMYLAVFLYDPPVVAPMFNKAPEGAAPLFPFLFITIACGAISGFHGLVASGTSSKQLKKMSDAPLVGYGGMLGEATLALMATLACTAGFASRELWQEHYGNWGQANGLGAKVGAFVSGGGHFLDSLLGNLFEAETSMQVSQAVVAVLVISFAATTLDSACRIQRFTLQELGGLCSLPVLKNRYVATLLAAFSPLILVLGHSENVPYWKKLWPIFGSSNQLLGALALLILTVYLARRKKCFWPTFLPMIYLMSVTFLSLITKVKIFYRENHFLLLTVSLLLLLLAFWISFEGFRVLKQTFQGKSEDAFHLK
jgi:carbon starvation protein